MGGRAVMNVKAVWRTLAVLGIVSLVMLAGCGGGASSAVNNPPPPSPPPPTHTTSPTITSIFPTTATAGGVGFDLAVNGKNFVSDSVVTWNGSPRPTTFFDGQTLSASIPESDITAPGTAQVTAMNPSTGGASNAVTFSITAIRLNSIEPAAVRAGGSGFALTLDGKGFQLGAAVHFGGSELTTTFVNTGQLTAQVMDTEIANPGVEEITVTNPSPSTEVSNPILFASTTASIGVTERVSVASDGSQANGDSRGASMSANSRFVAFVSAATNLASAGTTGNSAFLRDTCFNASSGCTPTTITFPVTDLVQGTDIGATSVSADGRFVAFGPNSENSNGDAFIWDTCRGVPSGCQPSVTEASDDGPSDVSYSPLINATGRYVAFTTVNFIATGPAAGFSQSGEVFVRDTCQGAGSGCAPSTNQVSFDEKGAPLNFAFLAGISADGRYVAFVHGEDGGGEAVFVRDTCAGVANCTPVSTRVSFDSAGNAFEGVGAASLSAEGRFVAFSGFEAQANRAGLFLRDTCLSALSSCTPSTTRVSVDNMGTPFVSDSQNPSISADGRFVAFELGRFDAFDATEHWQIVLRDTCVGAVGCNPLAILASQAADGTPPNGNSFSPFVSTDGSSVFTSGASNLVAGDTNGALDIFLARMRR